MRHTTAPKSGRNTDQGAGFRTVAVSDVVTTGFPDKAIQTNRNTTVPPAYKPVHLDGIGPNVQRVNFLQEPRFGALRRIDQIDSMTSVDQPRREICNVASNATTTGLGCKQDPHLR